MKRLETERLIIRKWEKTDLDDFFEYASVAGVGERAGWPHHENIEVSRGILDNFIKDDGEYALVLKENNKVIGSLGIHERKKSEEYKNKIQREIGYVLSRDYWGQGLMPEAVKALIQYAFEELEVDILWCGHFISNSQSHRVIEKCGFEFHSNEIYKAELLNKTFDEKVYVLTKEKYNNKC